jgi:hypothetical protein
VPAKDHADEARPLLDRHRAARPGGTHGPQLIGEIVPIVLARLGVGAVPSTPSGEADLT